ncbi:MAG: pilus assembly protein [Rhodobacterales bacterium]|nr:pilus assembly protein [Rhodobacterales bacterium]
MLRAIRHLIRLRRDDRGSPAIEFGLAAPVLVTIVVGTMEFGMLMFVDILMESALRDAARWGITGQLPNGQSRMAYIVDLIDERTLGLVDMSEANIQVLTYPAYDLVGKGESFVDGNGNGAYDAGETYTDTNGNGAWDQDMGVSGAGNADSVVVYRITYDWPLLTPIAGAFIGHDGKYRLRAAIAVKNEPWD